MALDSEAAEEAIRTQIAEPLGVSTVEAAALIRRIIDDKMASAIRKEVTLRGYRPSEFTLFAFGGGGPTHVAGYMGEIPRAVMFPFSPVFCAYGSSIMDVVHLYERSQRMMLLAPLTGAARGRPRRVQRDGALADGGGTARARVRGPELGRRHGQPRARHALRRPDPLQARVLAAALPESDEEDVRAVYERFEQEFSEAFSPLAVNVAGGVYIDTFVLRVAVPGQELTLPTLETTDEAPVPGSTRARRGSASGSTRRCSTSSCAPGQSLSGPAIVQAAYTTAVVPPGKRFSITEHGLGILEGE